MTLRVVRYILLASQSTERVQDTRALPGMGVPAADQIAVGIGLTTLAGLAPTPGVPGLFSRACCLRSCPWHSLPHA